MYIAFKWLVGFVFAMWIAMCGIDMYLTRVAETRMEGYGEGTFIKLFGFLYKNITVQSKLDSLMEKSTKEKQHGVAVFHFFVFLSGALAVSIFHRKNEMISFTKSAIPKMDVNKTIERVRILFNSDFLKIAASYVSVGIVKISNKIWKSTENLTYNFIIKIYTIIKRGKSKNHQGINFMLLKRLKEIGEERQNLGQLLIAAVHENKNIRTHYHLENMAKNRLVRHIENTQKQIKENRSRYVSFQQLYLVTHEENVYLKSRIRRLAKDKEEAEKNLMELINEVYQSKNYELKAYCSRFIVRTRDNLLNSDVGAEIKKFLQKSQTPVASTSNQQFLKYSDNEICNIKSWPTRMSEILQYSDSLVPLISEAPKLKGLPGEYVWTVKDKLGIIEKLYEYDCECNINDGDTIKRIRQYSVYYDKDCLLDFSNYRSKTVINEMNSEVLRENDQFVDYPLTRERFLTGSEAFRKFLQSNKSVVSTSRLSEPSSLCD